MTRRRAAGVFALVAAGVAAVIATRPDPPRPAPEHVLERLECGRCHSSTAFADAPRERSCVGCHQAILAGELDATGPLPGLAPLFSDRFPPWTTSRWKERLTSLVEVPSLVGIEHRLRRDWVVEYLQSPHDLRPGLDATMPRLPIDGATAEAVADALYGGDPGPVESEVDGDPDRGAALIREGGCLGCHVFGGSGLDGVAVGLAPDLRFTRERMPPGAIVAWLDAPGPGMPRPDLDDAKRRDVAAAIVGLPLAPVAPVPVPSPVAPPEATVTWADVDARVFHRVCWHCHSSGGSMGDGGPGNTGGFGYAGAGLDLSSREGVLAGSARGQVVVPGGESPLVRHLWARHEEVAGEPGDVLGMPLGLPPLAPADIALVEAWIAQGAP